MVRFRVRMEAMRFRQADIPKEALFRQESVRVVWADIVDDLPLSDFFREHLDSLISESD